MLKLASVHTGKLPRVVHVIGGEAVCVMTLPCVASSVNGVSYTPGLFGIGRCVCMRVSVCLC